VDKAADSPDTSGSSAKIPWVRWNDYTSTDKDNPDRLEIKVVETEPFEGTELALHYLPLKSVLKDKWIANVGRGLIKPGAEFTLLTYKRKSLTSDNTVRDCDMQFRKGEEEQPPSSPSPTALSDTQAVLAKMRQGSPLAVAAKEIGIDPRTVTRHLGNVLGKRNGKYRAKPTDKISRSMVINSRGRQAVIAVGDSKTASIIGQYHNAVRQYLNTGDKSALKNFENVAVVDSAGVGHRLETDLRRIKAIESAKEEPEFFEIYSSGGA
jgi:hypothetical protein